jgi:hypothetical protein
VDNLLGLVTSFRGLGTLDHIRLCRVDVPLGLLLSSFVLALLDLDDDFDGLLFDLIAKRHLCDFGLRCC